MTSINASRIRQIAGAADGRRFPAIGVVVDDPGPSPQFVIDYLIGAILDASILIPSADTIILAQAMVWSRSFLVAPAMITNEDRPSSVISLVEDLLRIYNLRADIEKYAPYAKFRYNEPGDGHKLSIIFVAKEDWNE